MSSVALRCRDVSVKFGSRVAVDSVSLDVAPGEWLGIIGPNGAGKSSLLGALAGVHGFDGTIARASDMPITRSDVAFVPQAPVVPEGMPSRNTCCWVEPHISVGLRTRRTQTERSWDWCWCGSASTTSLPGG